jgi:FkbM family methyltransferase
VLETVWRDPSNRGARVKRIGLAITWQAYKRLLPFPIVLTLDNGLLFYADPRSGNSTAAIYTRIYESDFIQFLRRECVPNGRIIDVGAHIGIYTLLLADRFLGGLCLEPAPDTHEVLRKNLALNGLLTFEARRVAASSRSGRGTLGADRPFSGTAHVVQDESASALHFPVELATIDELAKSLEDITLIKIDTEGHEAEVLAGAVTTLRRSPTALVLFENHSAVRATCLSLLEELGFRCFALDPAGNASQAEAAFVSSGNLLAAGPRHPMWERLEARCAIPR